MVKQGHGDSGTKLPALLWSPTLVGNNQGPERMTMILFKGGVSNDLKSPPPQHH